MVSNTVDGLIIYSLITLEAMYTSVQFYYIVRLPFLFVINSGVVYSVDVVVATHLQILTKNSLAGHSSNIVGPVPHLCYVTARGEPFVLPLAHALTFATLVTQFQSIGLSDTYLVMPN